ncbi:MAG: hypothetical protein HC913_08605 [Microscillaceae bacterium]|nr:hypothetical protein [Microscillaceae bacterium]
MKIIQNASTLRHLENIFSQSGYAIRYEKGNFRSGYCLLKNEPVVVINKYYPLEGKIGSLIEILQTVEWPFQPKEEAEKKHLPKNKGGPPTVGRPI